MELKIKQCSLESGGKTIAILNKQDAEKLHVRALERIVVSNERKKVTCIVNISDKVVKKGEIMLYSEAQEELGSKKGYVSVKPRHKLMSKEYIHDKVKGKELTEKEIKEIVDDILDRNLNDLELASLITAIDIRGLSLKEEYGFSKAMVDTSLTFKFKGNVVDKHSIGGVPGDKTSIVLVSILAAGGLVVPKTSSRAITDPAGTADRMEVFSSVIFKEKQIRKIVEKTNGCLIWGGSYKLAPADDMLIEIEHPLDSDAFMIPSILAKKKIMGAKNLVLDMPIGDNHAKLKTKKEARDLANKFIDLGRKLGINVKCALTNGYAPLGHSMGSNIEAIDILETFENKKSYDLIDKATSLAGILFEMSGKYKNGKEKAMELFQSGQVEKKFREIVSAQGGNKNIKKEDIKLGEFTKTIKAKKSGYVYSINNENLVDIANSAGCPKDKKAGIELFKKPGDNVKKGEPLFKIYSECEFKLKNALKTLEDPYEIKNKKPRKRKMFLGFVGGRK